MVVGDKVRVIESVWDDHRESDWLGWEGIIVKESETPDGKPGWFVTFPEAEGWWTDYDFYETELEVVNAE